MNCPYIPKMVESLSDRLEGIFKKLKDVVFSRKRT